MTVNYYLKMTGIAGSSNDPGHLNEIMVLSYHLGTVPFITGGGGAKRKDRPVYVNDFTIAVDDSKAIPWMMLAVASGRLYEEAVITCEELAANGTRTLRLKSKFINVNFLSGNKHPKGPSVFILNFEKVEFDSSIQEGWELM